MANFGGILGKAGCWRAVGGQIWRDHLNVCVSEQAPHPAPVLWIWRGPGCGGDDRDMAAQWATNEQQRLTAFRTLAQLLADRDALKPGLSVVEATDVIFGCSAPS